MLVFVPQESFHSVTFNYKKEKAQRIEGKMRKVNRKERNNYIERKKIYNSIFVA